MKKSKPQRGGAKKSLTIAEAAKALTPPAKKPAPGGRDPGHRARRPL